MKLSVGFGVSGVDATSKYKLSYTMLPPEAGQHSAFPTKFIGEVTPKRPTQPVTSIAHDYSRGHRPNRCPLRRDSSACFRIMRTSGLATLAHTC
jgi:hypothetical protein